MKNYTTGTIFSSFANLYYSGAQVASYGWSALVHKPIIKTLDQNNLPNGKELSKTIKGSASMDKHYKLLTHLGSWVQCLEA